MDKLVEGISKLFAEGFIPFFMATAVKNGDHKLRLNIVRIIEIIIIGAIFIGYNYLKTDRLETRFNFFEVQVMEVKNDITDVKKTLYLHLIDRDQYREE